MWKEAIISAVIVIVIVIGNVVTQNYTKESVHEISAKLEEIGEMLRESEENINTEEIQNKMEEININWKARHEKLAYYIEHNELESVETDLTALESYIKTNEYSEADSELEEAKFLLNHIQEKYAFNMQNVF